MSEKMLRGYKSDDVLFPRIRREISAKSDFCDHIRLVCATVAANAENYLPDTIYSETPGEVTIHIPLDGLPSVEVNTDTFLERE